jgi:5-formyltetrahydrofolate cyclo-ligase
MLGASHAGDNLVFSVNALGNPGWLRHTQRQMTPECTKQSLRSSMRTQFRETPDVELQSWSRQIVAHLQARQDLWETPGVVALFGGLRSEPDLISNFMPWLQSRGWKTVLFTISGTQLLPVIVQSTSDLKRGYLGVWEPVGDEVISHSELDLILVPGLAFAESTGARLGRGGGFYDRLLSRPELRAKLIGVAFQMQMMPEIPTEEHDLRVQEVITERGNQRVVPMAGIKA